MKHVSSAAILRKLVIDQVVKDALDGGWIDEEAIRYMLNKEVDNLSERAFELQIVNSQLNEMIEEKEDIIDHLRQRLGLTRCEAFRNAVIKSVMAEQVVCLRYVIGDFDYGELIENCNKRNDAMVEELLVSYGFTPSQIEVLIKHIKEWLFPTDEEFSKLGDFIKE